MAKKISSASSALVPVERIEQKIYLLSSHKVILDRDLAELYGVSTGRFNEAVKRNRSRFPEDFMFQLTLEEGKAVLALRSQNAILKRGQHVKYAPYAFTEHGVVMLSSVLNSERAVQMNILIVRAFVKLREMLATHKDLAHKIEELDRQQKEHGEQLAAVYSVVKQLINPPIKPKPRIGFVDSDREEQD